MTKEQLEQQFSELCTALGDLNYRSFDLTEQLKNASEKARVIIEKMHVNRSHKGARATPMKTEDLPPLVDSVVCGAV